MFIPARAGHAGAKDRRPDSSPRAVPRRCMPRLGVHPRARGAASNSSVRGFIPARARGSRRDARPAVSGLPPSRGGKVRSPRARGSRAGGDRCAFVTMRARGSPVRVVSVDPRARGGKAARTRLSIPYLRVHPRARGAASRRTGRRMCWRGSSPHARGLTGRGPVEQSETQTQAGAGSDAPYAAAVKAERRRNQPRGARAVRRSVTTRSSRAEGQRLGVCAAGDAAA